MMMNHLDSSFLSLQHPFFIIASWTTCVPGDALLIGDGRDSTSHWYFSRDFKRPFDNWLIIWGGITIVIANWNHWNPSYVEWDRTKEATPSCNHIFAPLRTCCTHFLTFMSFFIILSRHTRVPTFWPYTFQGTMHWFFFISAFFI